MYVEETADRQQEILHILHELSARLSELAERQEHEWRHSERLSIENETAYTEARIARLEQELRAIKEAQPSSIEIKDEVAIEDHGSAVAVGPPAPIATWPATGAASRPDWSEPMSEILEELNKVRGTIADLTSKFYDISVWQRVAASIFGNVGEIQQEEDLCFVLMPFANETLSLRCPRSKRIRGILFSRAKDFTARAKA